MKKDLFNRLYSRLVNKNLEDIDISYTSFLLKNPNIIAEKIGEESSEVIVELINKKKKKFIKESSDLIYHLMVACVSLNVTPDEIMSELEEREKISGFEEKKKRKY